MLRSRARYVMPARLLLPAPHRSRFDLWHVVLEACRGLTVAHGNAICEKGTPYAKLQTHRGQHTGGLTPHVHVLSAS